MLVNGNFQILACALWVGCMAAPQQYNRYPLPYQKRSRLYDMPEYQKVQPDERWNEDTRWQAPDWKLTNDRAYNAPQPRYSDFQRVLAEVRENEINDKYRQMDDPYNSHTRNEDGDEDGNNMMAYVDYNKLYRDLVRLSQQNADRVSEDQYRVSEDQYRDRPNIYYEADDDDWEQERPIEEDTWQRQPIDEDILKSLFKGGPTIDEETTENKLTHSVKPKNYMSLLQRVGMKLTDLSDQATPTEAENNNVERKNVDGKGEENPPISMEKAKSILQQLETEEKSRAKSNANTHTKEIVDENELAAMFGKNINADQPGTNTNTEVPHDHVTASHENRKREESEQSDESDVDDGERNEKMEEDVKDALLKLLQEQNKLLIYALQYAPIEATESRSTVEKIKTLIKGALVRQEDIDYLVQSMNGLTNRM